MRDALMCPECRQAYEPNGKTMVCPRCSGPLYMAVVHDGPPLPDPRRLRPIMGGKLGPARSPKLTKV